MAPSHQPDTEETTALLAPSDGRSPQITTNRARFRLLTTIPDAYLIIPLSFGFNLASVITTTTSLDLFRQFSCRIWYLANLPDVTNPTEEQCELPGPQKAYSVALTVYALVTAVGTMITYGAVGHFSTRYGRKPALMAMLTLCALSTLAFLGAVRTKATLSDVLLITWILCSTVATPASVSLICSMFAVDLSDEFTRTSTLSIVQGYGVLGLVPSYWMGGRITEHYSNSNIVFWGQLIIVFLVATYALVCVPESFPHGRREDARLRREAEARSRPIRPKSALRKPVDAFLSVLEPLSCILPKYDPQTGRKNYRLFVLAISQLLYTLGTIYYGESFLTYGAAYFHYRAEDTGFALTLVSGARVFALSLLMPAIVKWGRPIYNRRRVQQQRRLRRSISPHRPRDEEVIAEEEVEEASSHFDIYLIMGSSALLCFAVGLVGVVRTRTELWLLVVLYGIGLMHVPAYRSVVVASVHPNESGEALAAVEMVSTVGTLLAPLIIGSIMLATLEKAPEVPFLVASVLVAISAVVLVFVRDSDRYQKTTRDL